MGSSSRRIWPISLWILLMAIAAVSFLGACRATTEPEPTATERPAEEATEQHAVQSPLPTESNLFESPLAPENSALQSPLAPPPGGVLFAIDKPLLAGATRVTGSGPGGIELDVVDVTLAGEMMGSGVINDDNRFDIEVVAPLEAGRMIGIQLGVAREAETWPGLWALHGVDARAIPQIGYFFDTALTE